MKNTNSRYLITDNPLKALFIFSVGSFAIEALARSGIGHLILIDFDNVDNNIFKVVNQFTVEYTNNGKNDI